MSLLEDRVTYNSRLLDNTKKYSSLKLQFSLWSIILIMLIILSLLVFKNIQ